MLKGRLSQATSNRAFTIQTALFYRSLDQLLGIGLAGTSTLAVTLTFGVALPANDIDSGAQESTWMGKVLQDRVGFGLKNLIILLATVTNMGTVGLSIMGNCLKLADKLEGYRNISVRWSRSNSPSRVLSSRDGLLYLDLVLILVFGVEVTLDVTVVSYVTCV